VESKGDEVCYIRGGENDFVEDNPLQNHVLITLLPLFPSSRHKRREPPTRCLDARARRHPHLALGPSLIQGEYDGHRYQVDGLDVGEGQGPASPQCPGTILSLIYFYFFVLVELTIMLGVMLA